MSDPEGRRHLGDLVADRPERLFHVGRLDTDTSGLLILTNDGDFAQRLAHPSYEVDKTYVAEVEGEVHKGIVKQLLAGVTLDDGPVTVSERPDRERQPRAQRKPHDRRAGHPRGPQPDRAPAARARRPPRHPAHPHPDRPGRARQAAAWASCASSPSTSSAS